MRASVKRLGALRDDQRPLPPAERVAEVFDVGDEGLAAAAGDELDCGFDLWSHRAGGELPFGEVPLRVGDGEAGDRSLRRLFEIDRYFCHAGQHYVHLGAQFGGEERRGKILVDDCFHAAPLAVASAHDGDSAAAGGDHDGGAVEHVNDRLVVQYAQRPGGRDEVAPAATPFLAHRPAEVAFERLGAVAGEVRTY